MADWRDIVKKVAEEHGEDPEELIETVFELEMEDVANNIKHWTEVSLKEMAEDPEAFKDYIEEFAFDE